jgi:hypothetical protein
MLPGWVRTSKWWGLLLGGLGLLAVLYLACWPLVWRLVLLPRVTTERPGLEVITNDREDGKGRDIRSHREPRSTFGLERPYAFQVAHGVWRVEVAGYYDLRLECDDYGSLSIDRRLLIDLHGTSDLNQGDQRVYLEAGPHLLKLELHNRLERGWLRLLVKGPGQEEPGFLGGSSLATFDLGNYRAWLNLTAWLEQGCLFGLGLGMMAIFLLWALPPASARAASQEPPPGSRGRRRALAWAFVAAVILLAVVASWHTTTNQVQWGDWAAGHDHLSNEDWQSHRWVVENRYTDHRAYRVITDYALAGLEWLLQGHESDPPPARLLFWGRYFTDLLMFLLAALFYRRLGLSRPAVILGMGMLAWAMFPTCYRSGLNIATFLDISVFLLAGVLVLDQRWTALICLAPIAALNKETSILITVLPLACAFRWRPFTLPRRELLASALGLGIWLLVYGVMHIFLGHAVFNTYIDNPGTDFVHFNFFKDPDGYRQLFKTLGVLPFLALWGLRRAPVALGRMFWVVVPAWFVVHTILAWWAETRMYIVPMAFVFIPLSLYALRLESEPPAGQRPPSA